MEEDIGIEHPFNKVRC